MSNEPLSSGEFDSWAQHYDQSVSDEDVFPFTGYASVLETILVQSGVKPGEAALDLGAGTGNLSVLLAEKGAALWCLDFSAEMLAKARQKLPGAAFAQADLRDDWPDEFRRRYHVIVSAYTFHHFPLDEKVALVRRLLDEYLLPGGRLVIGDIAFPNAAALAVIRDEAGPNWDEEFYWLADETLAAFSAEGWQADYTQVSSCAGVFLIAGAA